MTLRMNLEKHRESIVRLNCGHQRVQHERQKWEGKLRMIPEWHKLLKLLKVATADKDFSINRRLLKDVAKSKDWSIEVRFLAQMIWGHAPGSNRGPTAVTRLMQQPDLQKHLEAAVAALEKGELKQAFNSLRAVKGLGMSYLTKVLYFEGAHLPWTGNVLPLIFDNVVSNAMVTLAIEPQDGWISEAVLVQRGDGWNNYFSYLVNINRLAAELDVTPEQLEYWLWLQGRGPGGRED